MGLREQQERTDTALTYKCTGDQWTVYCRVIREKNLCQDMRWYQRCCQTCRDFYANKMQQKSIITLELLSFVASSPHHITGQQCLEEGTVTLSPRNVVSHISQRAARRAILLLLEALAADTALEGKLALMATAEEWEARDLAWSAAPIEASGMFAIGFRGSQAFSLQPDLLQLGSALELTLSGSRQPGEIIKVVQAEDIPGTMIKVPTAHWGSSCDELTERDVLGPILPWCNKLSKACSMGCSGI
ncbi:hypothetical protein DV515_00006464 [Chloebia gouldiae]|uniref:PLAC domain-containing protein n=1 Tax=Chloebia gouldiae TaxID=44316 RepID=A0A3L8SL99_CHLGU|nr:hypothetical protein DV515_00006464 [Chloebia gouldiae]